MDRRITIERATLTRSPIGEPLRTWVKLADVWADINPINKGSGEPYQGQNENAQRETEFRIRYREDIDETMRISYAGETWDIEVVTEIGRHEGLNVRARTLVPA